MRGLRIPISNYQWYDNKSQMWMDQSTVRPCSSVLQSNNGHRGFSAWLYVVRSRLAKFSPFNGDLMPFQNVCNPDELGKTSSWVDAPWVPLLYLAYNKPRSIFLACACLKFSQPWKHGTLTEQERQEISWPIQVPTSTWKMNSTPAERPLPM